MRPLLRNFLLAAMVAVGLPAAGYAGAILREVYTGISGTAVSDLTSSSKYLSGTPDATNWLTDLFETPINVADSYGQRVRGYILPPQSGYYTFWIASDDSSELWLSTTAYPLTNLARIAYLSGWASPREWTKDGSQQSASIYLESGKRYSICALMKEDSGNDSLAVRWQLPDGTIEQPIPCSRLLPPGGPWTSPQIAAQPSDLTVVEGNSATFCVAVSNMYPTTYQWQRGGSNILAATSSNYVIPAVTLADSGVLFRCILTNELGSVTSEVATLTVLADTNRPVLSRVYNVDTTEVDVVFSEMVESNSATALTNYSLTGAVIHGVKYGADTRTIVLTVASLVVGSNYTLTVSNVIDRAAASNAILPGTQWTFTAREFALQDIGTPSAEGTVSYLANGTELTAGGAGIDGEQDACTLNYLLKTGDFDVQVRVARLDPSDPWAKAGIMARSTLDSDSPFTAVAATPSISGVSLQYRRASGANLLLNAGFELGRQQYASYATNWGAWGSAIAQTNREPNEGGSGKPAPSSAYDGKWMMYVTYDRTTTGNNWGGDGQWVAVTPGERYVFSAYYLLQSNLPSGQSTYMNLEWYDSAKSTEVGTRTYSDRVSAQCGWTYLAITASAPAGASYCKTVMAYEDLDGRTNSIGEQFNAYWDSTSFQMGSGGASESAGYFPVNYPYTWLRLKRQGNLFTAFASHDGSHWSEVESVSNALLPTVYLGMYATSHDDDETTTAEFHDWGTTVGGVTGSLQVTGYEPLGPSSRKTALVISEIQYHPATRADGKNLEFIELFNSDPVDADVSGFQIAGDVSYTIPEGTVIPGGGFLVIATAPADVQDVYGLDHVLGPLSDKLGNSSGLIQLRNKLGAVLLQTEYGDDDPWPVAADGAGPSLVLARPSYGEENPKAWAASRLAGGSPGAADPVFTTPYDSVKINELVTHTDPPQYDYIELYNHSTSAVDLAGCILSDDPTNNKCVLSSGTTIGAGGFRVFTSNELGFALSQYGETVYFKSPGATSVLDAVLFSGMENGASLGRYPDGAPGFHELLARTEGTNNTKTRLRIRDIVINEIMYHPISENDDDEYIELYNRGSSNIDLSGWAFTMGVNFTFPTGTVMSAGSYLVVARNITNLLARYPQLSATNTVGNYDGKLANSGERVVLSKLDDPLDTNGEAWVIVDDVTYGDGNSWGRGTDGDGSSLELIDAGADNRLADNWAGSIETNKSAWTTISYTGTVDNGTGTPDEVHVVLLNGGECLVDNVQVIQNYNRVTNGTFNTHIGGWIAQGNHADSVWNANGVSGGCLHIVADNDGDTGVNRIETDLSSSLTVGATATITARVRWLYGHPEILFRIRGNYLEASGQMEVPTNLGTPGMVNSRAKANTGPAFWDIVQSPVLPAAGENVLITARVSDTDAVSSVTLRYRVDPSSTTQELAMTDNGMSGDHVAEDGVYSAILPGQSAGTLIAYHLRAVDGRAAAATNFYPQGAPSSEALVRFGEEEPVGNFGTYRIWMTQANINQWASREPLDNSALPATFVYGSCRVIQNAGAYYRGSPFIRVTYNNPTGNLCAYHVNLPDDDPFLGTDKLNLDSLEPARDNTSQREKICFWMAGQVGLPSSHQRFVRIYVNGLRRGEIYGDSLQVGSDYVECWFPEESDGEIFKVDDWFEFPVDNQFTNFVNANATLQSFTTTDGSLKKARYRWSWEKKSNKILNDDYGQLLELVNVMNETNPEDYVAKVNALVDVDNWASVFALRHAVCDWDGYGYARGKNGYTYKPPEGRWKMLLWDLDFCLGNSDSHSVDSDIFREIYDPVISNKFLGTAEFRRAYLQAMKRLAENAMWNETVNPVCEANYAALSANGVSVYSPSAVESWISLRRSYILSQLSSYEAPLALSNNGGVDFSTNRNGILLSGTAPLAVKNLQINGVTYTPSWDSTSNWSVRVVLGLGSNTLSVVGIDADGHVVDGASDSMAVVFTGVGESPLGHVVINEIMYSPTNDRAQFVELFNRSESSAFDLRGMRFEGLDYTFAEPAVIEAGGYLVLAQNRVAFGSAYGLTLPVAAEFTNQFANVGALRLVRLDGTNVDLVVDEVHYDNSLPWPVEAQAGGPSLQLVDSSRDNDRVGNWAVSLITPYTPGAPNSTTNSLPPFPAFRLNELMSINTNVIADSFGDYDPWVELYSGGSNVLAVELHQVASNDADAWFDLELMATGEVTLVSTGSVWKYLDDGSDQGTAWIQESFNDASWASGPAELGYGDGDEATVVGYGPDENNRYVTTYFRRLFEVKNGFSCQALSLDLRFDDGAVVYLNGTEVFRTNMPEGTINNQTLSLTYEDDSNPFVYAEISPSLLRTGTNILAVEIHQCSVSSTDVSFDMDLRGRFEISCVATGATWKYLDDGSNQGTAWRANDFNDNAWESGPGPFGHGQGGEGTVISSNPVTAYFRKTFQAPIAWLSNNLTLHLKRDDGVVVYLNGSEILRDHLKSGSIAWTTTASSAISGSAATGIVDAIISPALLMNNETNLSNYYLSDTCTNLVKWTFPSGATMAADTFRLIWADNETNENNGAEYHANFRLCETGGCVLLVHSNADRLMVVDYVNYPAATTNASYGLYPDGEPWTWGRRVQSTPESENLEGDAPVMIYVNEWLADNKTTLFNEAGKAADWFELYNAGSAAVDLTGYTFSDDSGDPAKSLIVTNAIIYPGQFKLVWADNTNMVVGSTNLHANFALSKSGEMIGLYTPEGAPVDVITFGAQLTDVSQGRWWDGRTNIYTMAIPTPGAPNIVSTVNTAPVLAAISDKTVDEQTALIFTNTATDSDSPGQRLLYSLDSGAPVGATVNATNGVFRWIPTEAEGPSTNMVTLRVTDNGWTNKSDSKTFTIIVNEVNRKPDLAEIRSVRLNPGSLLLMALSASDEDVPANTLTFSLESGYPAGASMTPTGVFSWRPSDAQYWTTNVIVVRVTDDGSPAMSATGSMIIVVSGLDELFNAELSGGVGAGGLTIQWSSVSGEVYRVNYQQSLRDSTWSNLPPDILASNTVTYTVDPTAQYATQRFYRILRLLP